LKIINFKRFVLDLVKYDTIYITICANIIEVSSKKLAKFKISKKLRDLEDVCNYKLTKTLLELDWPRRAGSEILAQVFGSSQRVDMKYLAYNSTQLVKTRKI